MVFINILEPFLPIWSNFGRGSSSWVRVKILNFFGQKEDTFRIEKIYPPTGISL
jgi:hypothetical protein